MLRPFPRALRRVRAPRSRVLAAVLLACCLAPPVVAHADDLKDKRNAVQGDISRARGELDTSSAGLRRATAALARAQSKLDAAQARLTRTQAELGTARILDQQMQATLDKALDDLAEARRELREGRRRMEEQRGQLGAMAAASYQSADTQLMRLTAIFGSSDMDGVTRQLATARNLLDKELSGLDRMRASEVLLQVTEEQVQEIKDDIAVQRAAAAANLVQRESLEAKAAAAASRVADLVSQRETVAAKAERAKQQDLAMLSELEQERDRIAALLRARAEAARKAAAAAAAAARAQGRASARASAATGSGYLGAPVDGYVTSDYGWRTHPIYGYRSFHDGVDFGAGRCGVPIRAAASGTVVSRYYQSAYGNRLIIDHGWINGGGLATIYNHATTYTVGAGQNVARGQVIGYIGSTGWSTGCHLHFTVLRNGVATTPFGWL